MGIPFRASSHVLKKIQTCNESKSYCSDGAEQPKLSFATNHIKEMLVIANTDDLIERHQNVDILCIMGFFT